MRFAHLSLGLANQQRSRRFYETFFGLDRDGGPDAEGRMHLMHFDGFDLTLAQRATVSLSRHVRFRPSVIGNCCAPLQHGEVCS